MRGGPAASDLRNLEAAFARLSIRLELAEERISRLWRKNKARADSAGPRVLRAFQLFLPPLPRDLQ